MPFVEPVDDNGPLHKVEWVCRWHPDHKVVVTIPHAHAVPPSDNNNPSEPVEVLVWACFGMLVCECWHPDHAKVVGKKGRASRWETFNPPLRLEEARKSQAALFRTLTGPMINWRRLCVSGPDQQPFYGLVIDVKRSSPKINFPALPPNSQFLGKRYGVVVEAQEGCTPITDIQSRVSVFDFRPFSPTSGASEA